MIVCVGCHRAMRVKKNSEAFIEMAGSKPYKLWDGDLLECPECGAQVVYTGALQKPLAESHQPDFDTLCQKFGATIRAKEWNWDR